VTSLPYQMYVTQNTKLDARDCAWISRVHGCSKFLVVEAGG